MVRPDLDLPDEAFTFKREGELCLADGGYFILANIHLPILGEDGCCFVWTVWSSLSEKNFQRMDRLWDDPRRDSQEPAFGWLSNHLPTYEPSTIQLKVNVHTLPVGERPWLLLEPTEHALAVEQREGISMERIARIFHSFEHGQ